MLEQQLYDKLFGDVPKIHLHNDSLYSFIFNRENVYYEYTKEFNNRNLSSKAQIWLEEMMASKVVPYIPWDEAPTDRSFLDGKPMIQLQGQVHPKVMEKINTFVKDTVEKKFLAINNSFDLYYRSVPDFRNKLDEIQNSDQAKSLMDEFLKKVSPGLIAMDFRVIWMFENIEKDYHQLIDGLKNYQHGYIFDALKLNTDAFHYITERMSQTLVNALIPSLQKYALALQQFESNVEKLDDNVIEKELGLIVAACSVPFINEPQDYYEHELVRNVANTWQQLFILFERALEELKIELQYTLITVFGGLFIRASQEYRTIGLEICDLSFNPIEMTLLTSNERLKKSMEDFPIVINQLKKLSLAGNYGYAIECADQLCKIVENDILKVQSLSNGKSVYYEAHLQRAILYFQYLQQKNVDQEQFLHIYERMYSLLNIVINDQSFSEHHLPQQSSLFIKYSQLVIEREEYNRFSITFDYVNRMINRFESSLLTDEEIEMGNNDVFFVLAVLIALFVKEYNVKHSFIRICQFNDLNENVIAKALSQYKKVAGSNKFVKYYQVTFSKNMLKILKSILPTSY